jgi:membrane protease subunit (stomatin/prohibitin family)
VKVKSPTKGPISAFDNAYNALISVHDEGTYLEIN